MKFSLCILFAFIGLALAKEPLLDTTLVVSNSTRCVYSPESKTLNCRGFGGEVECDAIGDFTGLGSRVFNIFGLGCLPGDFKYDHFETVRYLLFPRALENQTYYNYSLLVDGKFVDLVLYYSENFVEYGIRVPSLKCYEKLVNLFRTSTERHLVRLEGGSTEVSLFGEVLMNDKVVQKKWIYGYGYGLGGYSPWGWGSYYPYYYYGK